MGRRGCCQIHSGRSQKPVITSDLPVFKEYLSRGEEVAMARAEDSDDLASAMAAMAVDTRLRRRLSQAVSSDNPAYVSTSSSRRYRSAISKPTLHCSFRKSTGQR